MAAFNRYDTVLNVVRAAAQLVGLEQPSVAVANPDLGVQQLVGMLTIKGRELSELHEWQQFERRASVVIGPSTENGVLLPTDWGGFISRTGWNETSQFRLIGPADAVTWQALNVLDEVGSQFSLRYRVRGSELFFEQYPGADTTISFEYYSRGWVQDFDASMVLLKDFCENDNDVVLFDSLLMTYALRLLWLEAKGFDTTSAQKNFDTRFSSTRNRDKDAPTLSLVPRRGVRLLDASNISETGFGR